jgi:glycosyltransferase involved in cell wall biosynthesis
MKIIFDLRNVGLGNNGGSLSIIKSANTLQDLGHEVSIIDSGRNQCTWTPLHVPHIKPKDDNQMLDADIVIATGYKSVGKTLNLPNRCGIKCHWIRAWELWQYQELHIVNKVLKQPTLKIVNSIGLQNKLKEYHVDSYIIRPGNDLDDFYPMNIRNDKKIVLGGLYHTRHKTKRSDWVINVAKQMKSKYPNIELQMFGINKDPKNIVIDKYKSQPTLKEKNIFYNEVDIWLAPTYLEGLHIVPQEAMLTECVVVGTNAPLSGLVDYIIHDETGLLAKNDYNSFCKNVDRLIKYKNIRNVIAQSGREKIISMGNRKKNMKKMVSLFEMLLGV